MYRRLLVALDGSELSRAAIPRAVEAASGNQTAIALLEVIPTRDGLRRTLAGSAFEFTGGDPEAIDELAASAHFRKRQEALDHLAQAEAELRDHGATSVTTHVAEGLPGNEIVDAAHRLNCQAVVMGTRGHSGLGREVVGSVAEYVLRHAGPLAVILVGSRANISHGPGQAPTATKDLAVAGEGSP
jgi:nucleotide-binding universal stress UspA family protein